MSAPAKRCNPINCSTFTKVAARPTRGIRKGETLPPETIEQVTTVDKYVAHCPYRTKDSRCSNDKETLKTRVY